jgi:hypothetical protein
MKEEKYHNSSSSDICAIKEEVKKSEVENIITPVLPGGSTCPLKIRGQLR